MHLYSLSLQQPTAIQQALCGCFIQAKQQEIVVSKGKVLQILRADPSTGKLESLLSQEVFGMIRHLQTFRLPGSWRDHLVLTSDSGRVVILLYDPDKNELTKVHQETYGKTGCRRIVPGQYLATDPKGRAFMLAAVEKQKFVYILNRDTNNKLTISSPLEAHKSHNIVFDLVGLDVGFENPVFACLEADYGETEDPESTIQTGQVNKTVTFYEMDFGLNHVVRKAAEAVAESAHLLISVPAGQEGPGGLIICCADFLVYRSLGENSAKHIVQYPQRVGSQNQQVFVSSYASHKSKDMVFYLLQSELGDLWKLSIESNKDTVLRVSLAYFDTVPLASSMCILKSGSLFLAAQLGNHLFMNFLGLGENETSVSYSTSELRKESVQYLVRQPENLQILDEVNSLSQISDLKVEDLTGEGNPQIYALCAANERSSLRVLRHGVAVNEMAVSQLPGKPVGVWTIKENNQDQLDKYIVLSFMTQTLVLSIGEKVVEISDSGLDNNIQTLHVALMEDNGIVQVFQGGIRHIKKEKRIHVWETQGRIVAATSNVRQLAIALQSGEIIYFELDALGQLTEMHQTQLDNQVYCLDIGLLPNERQRSRFLAVGLADCTVRVLSLDIETCLQRLSTQVLPALPESAKLIEMEQGQEASDSQLLLHVGLANGVLLRAVVDSVTGALSDARTRFLGTKAVKLFRISVKNTPALLSLSSRPWITYSLQSKTNTVPLSYEALDYASGFHSAECPHGLVGIQNKSLRIITPEKLGEIFNQQALPLTYSPRKLVVHPENHMLCVIESQHRCYPSEQRRQLYQQQVEAFRPGRKVEEGEADNITILRAPEGVWASGIRLVEPISLKTTMFLELENNEAAISISITLLANELLLLVGTVKDYRFAPKQGHSAAFLYTFRFVQQGEGYSIELLHKSAMDEPVLAIQGYQGKVLLGVGSALGLYELGKKKLLKKAELKDLTSPINSIQVSNNRIFVTDLATSVHCFRLKNKESTFHEFCDDVLPRWVTATALLDHHTIVALDKFESVSVLRVPFNIDEEGEDDHAIYKFRWETGYLNGALNKMSEMASFFLGDLGTTICKTSLMSTSNEVILYGTSMGGIGALYPFDSKEDVDFFLHLEMYLRIEQTPLSGREHIMFRSLYGPTKAVIDGDLCEQFSLMNYSRQKQVAEDLDRTANEVIKKLDDVRNRIL